MPTKEKTGSMSFLSAASRINVPDKVETYTRIHFSCKYNNH